MHSSRVYFLNLAILVSFKLCTSATLLEDVCRDTPDQGFCMNVLGSDIRTRDANIYDLGMIAVDLATNKATGTKVKIYTLLESEKDPKLRSRLAECENHYNIAIVALGRAVDHLKLGEYEDLITEGMYSYEAAYDCERAFKIPPAYTSPLTYENYALQQFAEIISVIVKLL